MRSVLVGLAAFLGGLGAVGGAGAAWVHFSGVRLRADAHLIPVVVAARPLKAGEALSADALTTAEWPEALVVGTRVRPADLELGRNKPPVLGERLLGDVAQGAPLSLSMLAGTACVPAIAACAPLGFPDKRPRVLVAKRTLHVGASLSEENTALWAYPEHIITPSFVRAEQASAVYGRTVRVDLITAGTPILASAVE